MPDDFEQMWGALAPLGRSAASGGYFRQPFTSVESELRSWFREQCAARGLSVEADGNGNLLAWWVPSVELVETTDAVLVGSHLDSVLDGGAYDGPLGVVSSLAAIDLLRSRGVAPSRPVAVGAFAEEEGSRFGIACLGSRLATGTTTPEAARELRDRDGVPLLDAMADAGRLAGPRPRRLARPDRLLPRAARRAGPRPGRPRRAGRAGHGDLAARALPVRLHRRGQPRGHDADGGPERPDAQLRDDRAGGRQAGPGDGAAGHLRPRRRGAQRHQRDPLAGDRVARRPVRQRGGARAAGGRDQAPGRRARRPGRHPARGDRGVRLGRGRLRPRADPLPAWPGWASAGATYP